MKVVYDISQLGDGHRFPVARTGLFRVIENIALGLAVAPECELSFCASKTPRNFDVLVSCLEYLESNPSLKDIPLPRLKNQDFLYQQINSLSNRLEKASSFEKLLLKTIRKSLHYSRHFFDAGFDILDYKNLSLADIFHSPYFPIPQEVRRAKNLKVFLTVHDLIPVLYPDFFTSNKKNYLKAALDSLKPNDWLIAVSQSTKNDLCNHLKNLDPSRVIVTPLAADPNIFYPCNNVDKIAAVRKRYNIPNAYYILSLCTLEPRKNIDHVIRSFAKLAQEQSIKDLYLVLVGAKGWSYDKIFEEIDKFDLARDRVILTGFVPDHDLAALYSDALVFVYLSMYEGFGLPPLEAMQCGLPVITSNTSSLPEVVGNEAIMLHPNDVDGLCQSLLNLYKDSLLRENLAQKSLKRSKLFSWSQCTQDTINAYKTALET